MASGPGRELVWSDEFDGPAGAPPDPATWVHETGGGGWGNGELQVYTDSPENAATDGQGRLVIRAVRAETVRPEGRSVSYTSARITTQRRFEATYGRVEVRAELPDGVGTWPAFWMLGTDLPEVGWPACGEIDVMEHVGQDPGRVLGTLHGSTSDGEHWSVVSQSQAPEVTGGFHDFAVDWEPDSITFSVDGQDYRRVGRAEVEERGPWPFDHPHFLLLNLAVGGTLGGEVPDATTWPQELVVDHVRCYR